MRFSSLVPVLLILFVLTAPRTLQAGGYHLEKLSPLGEQNRAALAIHDADKAKSRVIPANPWSGAATPRPFWSVPSALAAFLAT